jgi:D-alanyl-D-alanine carboxypeptidase
MKKTILILILMLFIGSACQGVTPEPTASSSKTGTNESIPVTETAKPVPGTSTSPPPTSTPTSVPLSESPASSLDTQIAAIRSFIDDQVDVGLFSGVVLIALEGVPIFQEAYGLANISLEIPNQVDTKFNLASMDKMFTAVAILKLVEEGKLSLSDEVKVYLPDYPNPEFAGSATIHQLLMHTSGLGNYFNSPSYLEKHAQIRSLDDYFVLFSNESPLFPAGEEFGYSNSGFIVLGLIIEAVSGQSYYEYVQDHIFTPSGMSDTACYELDAGIPNLALGYTTLDWDGNDTNHINSNNSMLPMRGGSAGGGYSTAPDLLSFSSALLSYQLLSPESTDLLMKGRIQIADGVQYAYGFFDQIINGNRRVGHGGGFPGICSIFGIFPELDISVIILSNQDYACGEVNDFIMETLIIGE